MLSHRQYIEQYASSHQNPANQIIHLICVPAIFFSSVAFAWLIPAGPHINLAIVAAVPMLMFYARLGGSSFLTGAAWLAVSFALCFTIQQLQWPLPWIAAGIFGVAWAVQFVGHNIEGAKPSFLGDLFFLLIGPLFVQEKLNRLLRTGSLRAC